MRAVNLTPEIEVVLFIYYNILLLYYNFELYLNEIKISKGKKKIMNIL